MNKISKISILTIIAISLISIFNIAIAAPLDTVRDKKMGDEVLIDVGDYYSRGNNGLYCVEHLQSLPRDEDGLLPYTVADKITIVGNYSIDHTDQYPTETNEILTQYYKGPYDDFGRSEMETLNGELAYIFGYQYLYYDGREISASSQNSIVQYGIWHNVHNWDNILLRYHAVDMIGTSQDPFTTNAINKMLNEAEAYGNSIVDVDVKLDIDEQNRAVANVEGTTYVYDGGWVRIGEEGTPQNPNTPDEEELENDLDPERNPDPHAPDEEELENDLDPERNPDPHAPDEEELENDLDPEADPEVEEESTLGIFDNTDQNVLNITRIANNKSIIGPFNYTFTGTLSKISFTVDTEEYSYHVDNVDLSDKNGNSISIEELESNTDFYIIIDGHYDIDEKFDFSIDINGDGRIKTATVWLLWSKTAPENQNLIVVEPDEIPYPIEGEFEYSIPYTGIKITKVVAGDSDARVEGADFIFLHTSPSGEQSYLRQDSYGNIILLAKNHSWSCNEHSRPCSNHGSHTVTKTHTEDRWAYQQGAEGWEDHDTPALSSSERITIFTTDINGEIEIKNIRAGGTITAIEIEAPEGYEIIQERTTIELNGRGSAKATIENRLTEINFNGMVWIDETSGKVSERDNLYDGSNGNDSSESNYNESEYQEGDRAKAGVKVVLYKDGREIASTVSGSDGRYEINDIPIGDPETDLQRYHIEFEYDGYLYENVTANLEKENGSKAIEGERRRENYNERFEEVVGASQGDIDSGYVRDNSGDNVFNLSYDTSEDYKSIYQHPDNYFTGTNSARFASGGNRDFTIIASTETADYDFVGGWDEKLTVHDINLGLYEREKPDLALVADLENVRIEINDHKHVYEYAQRSTYGIEKFDISTKFQNSAFANMTYDRLVYPEDYLYANPNQVAEANEEKEMKAYGIYKIEIRNQSTTLEVEINELLNYYDSRYEITAIGRELKDKNTGDSISPDGQEIVDPVLIDDKARTYNADYNQEIFDLEKLGLEINVAAQTTEVIYIEYVLDRHDIDAITNGDELVNNIIEVNSYTIYDSENSEVYAGIDTDSNPGVSIPTDISSFDDDGDRAPGLTITNQESREISGVVFEDNTVTVNGNDTNTVMTGYTRNGNGIYDQGENMVGDVEIIFTDPDIDNNGEGSGMEYRTNIVSEDGQYYIKENSVTSNNKTLVTSYAYTKEEYESKYPGEALPQARELKKGEYLITAYVPGDYILTYVWGNEDYQINNYKGTVYDKTRYEQNTENDQWHITEDFVQPIVRRTDAIDHYDNQDNVDNHFVEETNDRLTTDLTIDDLDYSTDTTLTNMKDIADNKMYSSTPVMNVGVEHKVEHITDNVIDVIYDVERIDLGITERAKQQVELSKRISEIKLTLANGQVFVDAKIDREGNITGQQDYLLFPKDGDPQIQIDTEITQGATLEVKYELVASNTSEIDYVSEDYYKYGIPSGNIVEYTMTEIIDYLDKDWAIDMADNTEWRLKDIEYLTNSKVVDAAVDDKKEHDTELIYKEVFDTSVFNDKIILSRKAINTAKDTTDPDQNKDEFIIPTTSNAPYVAEGQKDLNYEIIYGLDVSKVLTTSESTIELDNEIEIAKMYKTGGSEIRTTLGNYYTLNEDEEVVAIDEIDSDQAEQLTVIPPLGDNLNYVIVILVITGSLAIIAIGIVLIKKKVLNKK